MAIEEADLLNVDLLSNVMISQMIKHPYMYTPPGDHESYPVAYLLARKLKNTTVHGQLQLQATVYL